jgi:putative transposase
MKTFVYKLYQNKKNKTLNRKINICGTIYNYCIAINKRYYLLFKKSLNPNKLKTHITKLKKQKKYEYWKEIDAQAIQNIVERIDRAYSLFFTKIKKKLKCSPPSFKKVRRYKSFTLKQNGYIIHDDNKITIQGKIYKYFKNQKIQGDIKNVTIKRDSLNDIYLCITVELEEQYPIRVMSGKMAGVDFGLKTFLTLSDSTQYQSPEFYKKSLKEIKLLSKQFSTKKKGSNNKKRALLNLSRKHKKISNQRKDHHYKLSHELCQLYDILFFEDLNLSGMKKLWGRKISDLGFSSFLNILNKVGRKYNTIIFQIGRFYPSSKTCSSCGYIKENLKLSDRNWNCPECGAVHERDLNAAKNILRVGTSTLRGEIVRPAQAG